MYSPGRLVAGEGFTNGLGPLWLVTLLCVDVLSWVVVGLGGCGVIDLLVEVLCTEELLFLRPNLRIDPKIEERL